LAVQNHKPQSGDRNFDYMAKQDKPEQNKRDKAIEKDKEKMDGASKRGEGVR
jgi:hypothetical protein